MFYNSSFTRCLDVGFLGGGAVYVGVSQFAFGGWGGDDDPQPQFEVWDVQVMFRECEFFHNQAQLDSGGGALVDISSFGSRRQETPVANCVVSFENCTAINNTAGVNRGLLVVVCVRARLHVCVRFALRMCL
jgi:hypothetical protein